jgi:D-alanyl-D-alanine carboxypeptidase
MMFALQLIQTSSNKTHTQRLHKMTITKALVLVMTLVFNLNYAAAAPTASIAIDVDTNEVLLENNANVRLHPAGITKLMTLYVAFQAIESGEVSLDTPIIVSNKASWVIGSEVKLDEGTEIALRYLLRASAVGGANDASMAIAEGLSGSEELFAQRMNSTAKSLGLSRSTWKNPHGLTEKGHFSTASDIAKLFIAHTQDFPQWFNLFSRRTTDAGIRKVANTSRSILASIKGVTGAKYGYTRAAGYSGAAYVERLRRPIVVIVLGAKSKSDLTARMSAVIDAAFRNLNNK